jgi:hypothetical protein
MSTTGNDDVDYSDPTMSTAARYDHTTSNIPANTQSLSA